MTLDSIVNVSVSMKRNFYSPFGKGGSRGILTMLQYGKHLKKYSRRLRNEMTDAEKLLWSKIRGKQLKGFQVYRQKPIERQIHGEGWARGLTILRYGGF
jgi:Protein of unknown function (DUF559)